MKEKMKVDHYRSQRVPEYSFLVPAGVELSSYEGEARQYIEAFMPIEAVELDFDLEKLMTEDFAKLIDDLARIGLSMMRTQSIEKTAEESLVDGIG